MKEEWFKHPKRHPSNIGGPFYSLADCSDEECHSECLDCDMPQEEARGLIQSLDGDNGDTYFIKQPSNEKELQEAISTTEVCCVNAIRYGGNDPEIIKQIHPDLCDYKITIFGKVKLK